MHPLGSSHQRLLKVGESRKHWSTQSQAFGPLARVDEKSTEIFSAMVRTVIRSGERHLEDEFCQDNSKGICRPGRNYMRAAARLGKST